MPIPASPLTLAFLAELQARHRRELADALTMCAANDDVPLATQSYTLHEARREWVEQSPQSPPLAPHA